MRQQEQNQERQERGKRKKEDDVDLAIRINKTKRVTEKMVMDKKAADGSTGNHNSNDNNEIVVSDYFDSPEIGGSLDIVLQLTPQFYMLDKAITLDYVFLHRR